MMAILLVLVAIEVCVFISCVNGHARLFEPPSRASMWRFEFDNPVDTQDDEGFCGGFLHQQSLGGLCGTCGDPYDQAIPREHEAGGKYGNGIIVREYTQGSVIPVSVSVTKNHRGYFEFRICPTNDKTVRASKECLDSNLLTVVGSGTECLLGKTVLLIGGKLKNKYMVASDHIGIEHVALQLPEDLVCTQCVIQWRYHAGNLPGTDPDGRSCIGCGPQEEFYACADVAINPDTRVPTPVPQHAPAPASQPSPVPATQSVPTTESTLAPRKTCYAIVSYVTDSWCMSNCNHDISYCPPEFCECLTKKQQSIDSQGHDVGTKKKVTSSLGNALADVSLQLWIP